MWLLLGLGAVALYFIKDSSVVESAVDTVKGKIEVHLDSWTQFDSLFQRYGNVFDVDWMWLKAIALNESDLGREKSVAHGIAYPDDIEGSKSSDGKSWGLMQVTVSTGRTLDPDCDPVRLNDPEYSIKLAAQYISKLQNTFDFDADSRALEWTIKSYNQGPGNTKKEKSGAIKGYAQAYWDRFQRNLEKIKGSV